MQTTPAVAESSSGSLEASQRVQQEDIDVCERVQRGLGSSAYDCGRYAPRVEQGAHHFHRLLVEDLRAPDPPRAPAR